MDSSIYFKDVRLTVRDRSGSGEDIEILHRASGFFYANHLTAILGSSGAGKTSLFEILSGRLLSRDPELKVSGELIHPDCTFTLGDEAPALYMSYVLQEAPLVPTQTPREAFQFTLALRHPDMNAEDRARRVNETLDSLRLRKVADVMIGNQEFRGISGGERKRVAVGCALLCDSKILFLDEPTTGLDSVNALELMESLKQLSEKGYTVVTTLHQPSQEIIDCVDHYILMSDGYVVYCGAPKKLVPHYKMIGQPCPKAVDPLHHFLTLVSTEDGMDALREGQDDLVIPTVENTDSDVPVLDKPPAPLPVQVFWLIRREYRYLRRHPWVMLVALAQSLPLSFIIGALFFQIDRDQNGVYTVTSALFACTYMCVMLLLTMGTVSIPVRVPQLERDLERRLYRAPVFIIVEGLAVIPFTMLLAFTMAVTPKYMIGLDVSLWMLAFCVWLCGIAGMSIGGILGAIAFNVETTPRAVHIGMTTLLIFSGFFIVVDHMPVFFQPIARMNPTFYVYRALMASEMRGSTFHCSDRDMEAYVRCPVTHGWQHLEAINVDYADRDIADNILIGVILITVYRIMAALLLAFRMQPAVFKACWRSKGQSKAVAEETHAVLVRRESGLMTPTTPGRRTSQPNTPVHDVV